MDNLNFRQIVLIAALTSFLTSSVVAFLMLNLYGNALVQPQLVGFLNPFKSVAQQVLPTLQTTPQQDLATREINVVVRQDDLVVGAVKRASPAVVAIVATKDLPVVEQYFVDPFGNDPFFKQLFPDFQVPQYRQKGTEEKQVSSGSGFIISLDGLIATNKHVVEDTEAHYTVLTNDGKKFPADVLARDPFQDFAVLKIDGKNLPTLPLGNSGTIAIGQSVIAIGNALGEFRNTVSVGVISGLRRSLVAQSARGSEELRDIIQTDAAINPGNSGGPLLNLNGEVIGINTAMAQGAENIGFAIPINKAKRSIEDVKATGKISHPFLGVRYIAITPDVQKEKQLSVDHGILVIGDATNEAVVPGSPAEKAGIKGNDIILEFGGIRVDIDHPLSSLIGDHRAGEQVPVKIFRDGHEIMLKVTLEEKK